MEPAAKGWITRRRNARILRRLKKAEAIAADVRGNANVRSVAQQMVGKLAAKLTRGR